MITSIKDDVEYVIYVRKSTDDASGGRQAQSIPDQIQCCIDYAKKNNLKLRERPENFEFDSEEEIRIEDAEEDIKSRKIYQESRQYYIIKERMSGKFPGRPKRNLLIDKIRNGEIKGLLSYSPDRQARNMVDGGILIDCVDCDLVKLQYTNFNFEPNAGGKMMLGMRFVFSKQYSDKLGEDVDRGKKFAVEKGCSQGEYKYGYYVDESKHYVPDGDNFNLMREAFRMKVEDKASDTHIANWLNAQGFYKNKGNRREKVKFPALSSVWIDSFYYGLYVSGKNSQDLRNVEGLEFKPLIPEERYDILVERNQSKKKKQPEVKDTIRCDEYAFSLPIGMLKLKGTEYSLSPYITKKKHRLKMYELALKENPSLTLDDFIQSSRVRYEIKTNGVKDRKGSKTKSGATISINQDVVEKKIMTMLSKIQISDDDYKAYADYVNNKVSELIKKSRDEKSSIEMKLGTLRKNRKEFIKKHLGVEFKNDEEKEIYEESLAEFDKSERLLRTSLSNVFTTERDLALEMDIVVEILKRAANTYKDSSNVRKRKIAKILFPNIYVDNKKGLTIEVNPFLKNILRVNLAEPGLARIELATRGFGDHRSTSELQPYFLVQLISLIQCLKHDISSKE